MKTYKIKEIHPRTFQGEGRNAGLPITLVRFAGCNIWSGREEDRAKATAKGMCATWCDTDFRGTDGDEGGKYTLNELTTKIISTFREQQPSVAGRGYVKGAVMFTGGEPCLQLNYEILVELMQRDVDVLVETNGTIDMTFAYDAESAASMLGNGALWVTVSPKPPAPVNNFFVENAFNELKVVYDYRSIEPVNYVGLPAMYRYLQPLDSHDAVTNADNVTKTMMYVSLNPRWKLGLQSHKIWGAP